MMQTGLAKAVVNNENLSPTEPPPSSSTDAEKHLPRNFAVLAMCQIVTRVGWIFKTESIIIPAVLDTLAGAGWLRGCLPLLNRFGQSIPPLLMARRIRVMPRKTPALVASALGMACSFLLLASLWFLPPAIPAWWMPAGFLACYTMFFMCVGVHQLAFGTLQGKLVLANRRGRLLLVATVVGVVVAVAAALLLMPLWIGPEGGRFELVFGFAGLCFLVTAALAALLKESVDDFQKERQSVWRKFAEAGGIFRRDPNFRMLALASMLVGTSLMLFPHHQALARERLSLQFDNLMWWVVVQNIGTALFSLVAGPLADRKGNRSVLRLAFLGVSATPFLALALAHSGQLGAMLFSLVFLFVGLTPITIRIMNNYTLEICEPDEHPQYLAALSLCTAAPFLLSPLVGLLVDWTSFEAVFTFVAAINFLGWLLTFRLWEPRHHLPLQASETIIEE